MDYSTKMAELQQLQKQVSCLSSFIESKEKQISVQESMLRQRQVPNNGPQNLQYNMKNSLEPLLTPGNINDINAVIWPFFFTTDVPLTPLAVGDTFQTGYSVTHEAAFIMMSFTKTVYLVEGEVPNDSWTYLNPDVSTPSAPGLTFTLRDGSSSRQLFNTPMNIDHYGNPRYPTKFPRPVMLLPNQVMQIAFVNSHPTNLYIPFITAFGYRIRIEEAQKLLSLVYG